MLLRHPPPQHVDVPLLGLASAGLEADRERRAESEVGDGRRRPRVPRDAALQHRDDERRRHDRRRELPHDAPLPSVRAEHCGHRDASLTRSRQRRHGHTTPVRTPAGCRPRRMCPRRTPRLSIIGGSMPTHVRTVPVWLRWSVPWWSAWASRIPRGSRSSLPVFIASDRARIGGAARSSSRTSVRRPPSRHGGAGRRPSRSYRVASRLARQVRQVVGVAADGVPHGLHRDRAVVPGTARSAAPA